MARINIPLSILFLVIAYNSFFAQQPLLDSLKTELSKAKHDTLRCSILSQMIEAESNDTIWPKYNEQLKNIAEANLQKKPGGGFKNHLHETPCRSS